MFIKGLISSASVIALAGAVAVPTDAALAQTEQAAELGSITGTVVDENLGTPLGGAIVRIPALGREVSTQQDGSFRFPNVPAGTYELTVTYFGGEPFGGTVTVTRGEAAQVTLAALAAAGIVVRGERGNIAASRSRERSSDVLQSVVSADAAGEYGDQNLAESLQRVPGVSIIRSEGEGTQVSIRGLSPAFTKVTVGGVQVGASGDGRETSLDVISSDLTSAVTVSKYQLPDQPADAIGGTVDIEPISAFDRGGFSLNLRAEGSYQEERNRISPIFSGNMTYLTGILGGEDNLGISLAANWSKRRLAVDVIEGGNSPNIFTDREGDRFYVDDKIFEQRELADRERWGVSAGLEFRPTPDDRIYLRGNFIENEDLDRAINFEWDIDNATVQFDPANPNRRIEVLDLEPNSFILTDADAIIELSYQPETDRTKTLTFGGEHFFADDWKVDYQAYYSRRKIFKHDFIKGEFRERDFIVQGTTTGKGFEIDQISVEEATALTGVPANRMSGTGGDINDPSNFEQIQVQTEEGLRDDEFYSAAFNVTRDFLLGDRPGYLKAGASYLDRSQLRDRQRTRYNPTDRRDRMAICGTSSASDPCVQSIGSVLTDYNLVRPDNSIIHTAVPTFAELVPVLNRQRDQFFPAAVFGSTRNNQILNEDDYDARERITAAYGMGQIEFSDVFTLTGGVRVENTRLRTNGFLTVLNETVIFPGDPEPLTFTAKLDEASNEYTDFFPSLLLRIEPTQSIVMRAAYSTSTLRPSFRQTRNSITTDDGFNIDDAGTPGDPSDDIVETDFSLELGRPDLDPYFAHNFDASVAWYPNRSTVLSVAGFYKKVTSFIVDAEFNDVTLTSLGFLELPSVNGFTFDPNQVYQSVETTLNGDSAKVYGVEFDFTHTFTWLPRPLSGIFVQGNLTLSDSKAAISELRPDPIPLVGQADRVANLSVGYEDSKFTFRVAGNYSSERLAELGGTRSLEDQVDPDSLDDRYEDQYIDEYFSVDLAMRYRVSKMLQLSFDAININDESDDVIYKQSYRNFFSERELFGRTYKFGVRLSF